MGEALHEPFLRAAREHRLVVQRCRNCGYAQLPPKMRCERCDGRALEWVEASGQATLASFTVLHRAPPEHSERTPYVYALVDLEEGPRIVTNIVGIAPEEPQIGQPLRVVFERFDERDGQPWPEFTPIMSRAAQNER